MVTLVHPYDGMLSTVSRAASQVTSLLCCFAAGCSAERAPVLDTDFCPQLYVLHVYAVIL